MFKDFDFRLLNSPDFKEDSVREELITPLLHKLGYRASGYFQIIRSKSLLHPFVMIGTIKRKIYIIPDYLMRVYKDFAFILDAKHPNEIIASGKNVEQAYSYAIHPDIRVQLYALCNGHELTIFHVNQIKPIIQVDLIDIVERWEDIKNVLSPQNVLIYKLRPNDSDPDYGLHLYKLGYANQEEIEWFFYDVLITNIARISPQAFSFSVNLVQNGIEFGISFDFSIDQLESLVNLAPEEKQDIILNGLNLQPFQVDLVPPLIINIGSRLGSPTQTKEFKEIAPLIITKFF